MPSIIRFQAKSFLRPLFPEVSIGGRAGQAAEVMRIGRLGEYQYSVDRDLAGAGRTVWRWMVTGRDAPLARGTSIRSEDDAREAALRAIKRLRAARLRNVRGDGVGPGSTL